MISKRKVSYKLYQHRLSITRKNSRKKRNWGFLFSVFILVLLYLAVAFKKRHGVRSLTHTIFTLPFVGKNFFRGIVKNQKVCFGKVAAYDLLKVTSYNWRRLFLFIGQRFHGFLNRLTNENRETVLIIDDSPCERSRSKL